MQSFVKEHPDYLAPNNALNFLVDSNDMDGPYNLCHFWSNFEIADLRFWRSQVYEDFFNYLDATGQSVLMFINVEEPQADQKRWQVTFSTNAGYDVQFLSKSFQAETITSG